MRILWRDSARADDLRISTASKRERRNTSNPRSGQGLRAARGGLVRSDAVAGHDIASSLCKGIREMRRQNVHGVEARTLVAKRGSEGGRLYILIRVRIKFP